jgi:hypothetical protein
MCFFLFILFLIRLLLLPVEDEPKCMNVRYCLSWHVVKPQRSEAKQPEIVGVAYRASFNCLNMRKESDEIQGAVALLTLTTRVGTFSIPVPIGAKLMKG